MRSDGLKRQAMKEVSSDAEMTKKLFSKGEPQEVGTLSLQRRRLSKDINLGMKMTV